MHQKRIEMMSRNLVVMINKDYLISRLIEKMKVRQRKANEYKAIYGKLNSPLTSQERKLVKQRSYQWFHIVNNWLKANKDDFTIPFSFSWRPEKDKTRHYFRRPHCRYKRDLRRNLVLKFHNVTPYLRFCIRRGFGCTVAAYYPINENWDLIFDVDIYPNQLEDGRWAGEWSYIWDEENPDKSPLMVPLETFSSLQALTEKRLLEPLLQWVNETLAGSKWLCLYETDSGGVTWATIEKDDSDESERYRMQLRHEQLSAGFIRVDEGPNTLKAIPTKVDRYQPVHKMPLFVGQ